jgi:hypothetical protein
MKRLIVFAALTHAGVGVVAAEGAARSSILIQSDLDFHHCQCVTGGLGTPSSPYISARNRSTASPAMRCTLART